MEQAAWWIALVLLVLGIIAAVAGLLIHFFRELLGLAGLIGHTLTPLAAEDRAILARWSAYYRTLPPALRTRFERQVKELIFEKEWIGKGIEVTREMRVRIAAAAAQVTLGFDRLLLIHFSHILIFPDTYLNKRTGKHHLGEVIPKRGTIVLSWSHFQQGFATPDDAHNVGLHEMAHALWFEDGIENGEDHFLSPALLTRWKALAAEQIERIGTGQPHFFRAYAGTNQAEFFAVAVEYFFEQPVAYQERLPELYACMCALLRQDPARSFPGAAPRE